MDPLTFIATKYDLDLSAKSPIEIPNTDRVSLARLFYLLGCQRGAEVGVERGAYSEVLCRHVPGLDLLCVDAWQAYPNYRDHVVQSKLDRFYRETAERLQPYRGARLVRQFSVEAARDVPDGSLDFAYLDAAHDFPSLTADLAAWTPKVRAGGIIAGHDFAKHRWPNRMHVVQVVQGWTDAYDIRPWFVLGRREKRAGEKRDDARSFFWVHEPRPVVNGREGPIRQ